MPNPETGGGRPVNAPFGDFFKSIPVRQSAPRVLEVPADAPAWELLPEGSLVFLVAQDPAPLAQLADAVANQQYDALGKALAQISSSINAAISGERFKNIDPKAIAAFADLDYGDVTIASGLFIYGPMFAVAATTHPYSGGPLDYGKFSTLTYLNTNQAAQLNSLVLVRPPRLSPLEQAVLARVPGDLSDVHLGKRPVPENTWLVVGAVAVAAVVFYAAARAAAAIAKANVSPKSMDAVEQQNRQAGGAGYWERVVDQMLAADTLHPTATAQALLNIRTAILSGQIPAPR